MKSQEAENKLNLNLQSIPKNRPEEARRKVSPDVKLLSQQEKKVVVQCLYDLLYDLKRRVR